LRIKVHREIPDDPQLSHQWNELVLQMEHPEVFYTFEWALAVERAYRSAMKTLLVLAYEGESLIGVAALANDAAEKRTSFLAGNTADYCDFICPPEGRADFVTAVLGELANRQLPMLRLANLPADSSTSRVLRAAAGQNAYRVFSRPAYQCARVTPGSSEERRKVKQSVLKRKAFRYYLRGLEKKGKVEMDHLTSWNEIQTELPSFIHAHVARFEAGGRKNSNLATAERQAFLSVLAESLSNAGWLVLTRLLVNGQAVAWNYGFRFGDSWFYYQPTFDATWREFSPGFCLLTKMVEQACDEPKVQVLDLGLGEESYKGRFATGYRQTLHATITDSATVHVREKLRYHAASAIKSSSRLEHWVRRLTGRSPAENAKA
jgi:CelD/BcsL family acetyltransferase involved in cellulose biosynthesis